MSTLPATLQGHRDAYLLALAGGLLLVVWAPVPAAYQLALRAVILGVLYIALVARIWHDAVETLDCDDPHLAPRCQEQFRRYVEQHAPTPRTAALTPVQRRYLTSLSRHEESQEERHA